MVFAVVILFVCLAYGSSARFQDTNIHSEDLSKTVNDYFLCRHCGTDISPLSSLISIDSPAASKSRVSQLFGLKNVKVQTVKNSLHSQFEILTLSKTLCVGKGNWQTEDSWFPGYVWKVCVCAKCGRHIGWMFEPLHLATSDKIYPSKEGFYVVIISSIINELHADSLIVVPKHFSTIEEISD
ncbi:protein cereblon homolog [Melanaphis sacchari]|uniref:Protein cereblon n=1 Tax=Melanaphis sacchari TaxID=742174 RepID=A0A2H8TGR7_9HEMI|nr:protein cereblon homolog [Melanaphis sacchari]XP_025208347.1 protein cereblon homolog [Melanaphis sacchari]